MDECSFLFINCACLRVFLVVLVLHYFLKTPFTVRGRPHTNSHGETLSSNRPSQGTRNKDSDTWYTQRTGERGRREEGETDRQRDREITAKPILKIFEREKGGETLD